MHAHALRCTAQHETTDLAERAATFDDAQLFAVDREPPRRGLSRPRHLLSFFLVAIALIGGVLAVVDLRREDEKPNDLIIVLDTSASTLAREWRFARAWLTRQLGNLDWGRVG